MKIFFKTLILLITLFLVLGMVYKYRNVISGRLEPVLYKLDKLITQVGLKRVACTEPISYTLGTFDPKFNISKSYFLEALVEAELIWEKPYGKELFSYVADTTKPNLLKVNLIYDQRQDATNKLSELGIVVKENRASYEALRTKFAALKLEFAVAKKNYDLEVKNFNTRQEAYEKEVEDWNGKGGAPRKEYDALSRERASLNQKAVELQSLQNKVNAMVDEMNAMVVVLNRLAKTLNIIVEDYNTVGTSRGESFTEGVYIEEGFNRHIDIYEFSSHTKLVRVLAHELGHALGLGHVEDPKGIMYELNQDNNQILTADDLAALHAKCGVE